MEMQPCWIFRYEAEGYDERSWLDMPYPDDLPCVCDDPDGYHTCVYDYIHAMCGLDADHAGPHQFVHQSEVTLTFASEVS